jgi:hypothetical protein
MYSPFHPAPRSTHNVLHLLTRQAIGDLIRRICFLWEIGNRALLRELIENLAKRRPEDTAIQIEWAPMIHAFATLTCSFYSNPRPGTRAASETRCIRHYSLALFCLPAQIKYSGHLRALPAAP